MSATTNDVPLGAQAAEFFSIDTGENYLAAVVSSGTGVLYITRLK